VLLVDEGRCRASTDRVPAHTSCPSIAGTLVSRGLAAASASKRHSAQNVDRAVSQLQATTGPLRHPSAVEVCRVSSRRLDRSRSVRLPVPWISICASRGDNEACSSCTSSFAPEPAYARGYRLSTRGGGARRGVRGGPSVTNPLLLPPGSNRRRPGREHGSLCLDAIAKVRVARGLSALPLIAPSSGAGARAKRRGGARRTRDHRSATAYCFC
jgi:hypothetical protein